VNTRSRASAARVWPSDSGTGSVQVFRGGLRHALLQQQAGGLELRVGSKRRCIGRPSSA
jgi:hypothetical protein